ncbi:RNA polymerase sigma factor SigI [Sporosarcina sp. NCCP-2222]|uniref:RNA polymerase sigma-I factor n=1 Tax=Sporosarcina sp. NCCP-2222 TaxID=2935073 RepID=UPI00208A3FDC|nr:RNA polymerase sigma-I factor [Sporosarcina sp. NCCP-2222]GKV56828.1 RNA polymerase sigma factor SigI [Sporosarcina sp. NCCP-2222]
MFLSLIQGMFHSRKTDHTLHEQVWKAKRGDEEVMNDLLSTYTPFMKKTASFICNRRIDEHDDEFSIAMNAFHEAILTFETTRYASLTTFAYLVIKRRLIDFIRKETAYSTPVLLVDANKEADASVDELHPVFTQVSIQQHTEEHRARERKDEIRRFNVLLTTYGLSFGELSRTSPKHADTRRTAIQIAQIIAETPTLFDFMDSKKQLPIKELERLVDVSRKTIERHRKYIMAIVLLLKGDFIYIQDYVKGDII